MNKRKRRGNPRKDRPDARRRDELRREDRNDLPESAGRNDVSWYTRYPNLTIAAGSFPYPYRPGMSINLGQAVTATATAGTTATYDAKMTIPGVLVLDWMPSIGKSNTATDPASVMAKEIYAKVRQKYSGSLEADAPDFVMYLMALDSIFSYIAWLKRLYRVMNAWTPENYVLPDVLISSMGFTQSEIVNLRANRVRLWQCINELVLQSRKFMCPATMDIFNRHYWMSDNVYTDTDTINSQFYLFNLKAVYMYEAQAMPNGDLAGGLQMMPLPTAQNLKMGKNTVDTLYQFGLNLIEALVAWDDAYTINGYLMRAYEGAPTFIVDELPAEQPFTPVYVPEVLSQIENSRAIPFGDSILDEDSMAAWDMFNVSQDVLTNAVISNPRQSYAGTMTSQMGNPWLINPMLSVRSMTPTVADSVIASRLQAAMKVSTPGAVPTFDIIAATEIPISWRLVNSVATSAANLWSGVIRQALCAAVIGGTEKLTVSHFMDTFAMEQFDWHPFVIITRPTVSGTNVSSALTAIIGDTHNLTTIGIEDLRNLHKICMYSELNSFSA